MWGDILSIVENFQYFENILRVLRVVSKIKIPKNSQDSQGENQACPDEGSALLSLVTKTMVSDLYVIIEFSMKK